MKANLDSGEDGGYSDEGVKLCSAGARPREEIHHIRRCRQQITVGLAHYQRFQTLLVHRRPDCRQRASHLAECALRLRYRHGQDCKDLMG